MSIGKNRIFTTQYNWPMRYEQPNESGFDKLAFNYPTMSRDRFNVSDRPNWINQDRNSGILQNIHDTPISRNEERNMAIFNIIQNKDNRNYLPIPRPNPSTYQQLPLFTDNPSRPLLLSVYP